MKFRRLLATLAAAAMLAGVAVGCGQARAGQGVGAGNDPGQARSAATAGSKPGKATEAFGLALRTHSR